MIDDINAKRMTEVEVLLRKFEDLSNQHEEKINVLNNAVKREKAEKESLKSSYTSQLNCSAEELRKLHEALKIKELHNSQLQQERDNCNANMSTVLQKQDELSKHLKENQSLCNEKEKEIFALQQQISQIQDANCKMHILFEKSEEAVQKSERRKLELEEQLSALKLKSAEASEEFRNKISKLECLIESEITRKKEIESTLNEKEREIEELKEKHDSIIEKLNESTHQCDDMQMLMEELGKRKLYLEESVQKQQESLQQLRLANDELSIKGQLLEDAQKKIMQQEEELSDLKKEHAVKLTSLDGCLKEKQNEIDKLQSSNASIEEELKSNLNKIENLEKQIKVLNKKLKIKTKVNSESKDKLQSTIESTVKENESLVAKTVSLQEELEKTRSEWETEKKNVKNLHKLEMKEILDLLDKTEENYRNTTITKEAEIQELKNEITKLSNERKNEQKKLDKMEKDWEKEKSNMKELHSSQMKDVFDILKKAEESYLKTILAKEGEAEELKNEISNYNSRLKAEENKETEINRLRYEKENLQAMMETLKESNEMETSKLKRENDKLHTELESLQECKETARRLHEEKYQLQAELDRLRELNEKTTVSTQHERKDEVRKTAFDNLLQDTSSANIIHCTVKRSTLATAEVLPKPRQDYKSYTRNSSYITTQPEKKNTKRPLMPITEVKPLQEEKLSLDPKPKQRKFFKSSRSINRQIKDNGLLWFDIDEEEE